MKKLLVLAALAALILGLFGCLNTVPVVNQKPTALFTVACGVDENTLIFDGDASYDGDGNIVEWKWRFGDDTIDSGVVVSHTFLEAGTWAVILIVTDNSGGFASFSRTITIASPAPVGVPVAWFNYDVQTDSLTLDFDGSLSHDVHVDGYADGYINWATWDFGDGTNQSGYWTWRGAPMAMYASHDYDEAGFYTVRLTVKDNEGYTNATERYILVGE